MDMNQREHIKELWNSFTETHKPYLQLGSALSLLRQQQWYVEWGHKNIQAYLKNELHMPLTLCGIYISAAKHIVTRLQLTPDELHKIEEQYPMRKAVSMAKVSKTKDELIQRLQGTYRQESPRKRYTVCHYVFSAKEMDLIRIAKLAIGGGFPGEEKLSKAEVLKIAITAASTALPMDVAKEWIRGKIAAYKL